ncbi:CNP1-like family protein [Thauera sedimentorum]|uniref:CNP1-like family protein n=1 Tax=Thauera sedimentorum TaxID=2767595 RepID=UPI001CDD7501|nr:CNP1-like family protein [Thauera sedimentorum]
MKSLHLLIRGGLAALVCFSGPVSAQFLADEEANANWKEGEVEFPPAPAESSLREFFVSSASPNTFLIDEQTLSVGEDGVVRYVLVVRTPGGAENVTFEGIRCNTGERRIYASGRRDGSWSRARNSEWAPISDNSYNRPRAALARDHFCDGPAPPRNRDEVLRRLQQSDGANPIYR